MRLDQLKYLIHVAEVGSITKSAEDIYISQQGLSQAIKQMEIKLGVTLFQRNGNKLIITDAGRKTVEKAREILAIYNELLASLESHTEPETHGLLGEIEVFSQPVLCETVLPVTLNYLQKKFPNIKVKVQETGAIKIPGKVYASSKGIGLLILSPHMVETLTAVKKSDLKIEALHKYKIMACISKSSALAKKSAISFSDFIKHPLSVYNLQIDVLDDFHKGLHTPNILLNSTNIHLCRETIGKGLAIGLTDGLIEKYLENKSVIPLPFEEEMDIVFCYMASAEMLKKNIVKEFLKALKSKAAV